MADPQAQLAARLGRFKEAEAAGEKGLAASANDPVWRATPSARLAKDRAGVRVDGLTTPGK